MKNKDNSNIKTSKASKKGRFNIIDFMIIIVILFIIAALVFVFLPTSFIKNLTSDKTVEIEYAIEVLAVDEEFLENINEGDTVLNSKTKSNIGTVKALEYSTPYTELKYDDENDRAVLSEVPGRYNLIVTISATAEFIEGEGYTVNGTRIAVGESVSMRFPEFICEGHCISVPRD